MRRIAALFGVSLVLAACGGDSMENDGGGSGGNSQSSGATPGSGGNDANGGGSNANGGSDASGGTTASGGDAMASGGDGPSNNGGNGSSGGTDTSGSTTNGGAGTTPNPSTGARHDICADIGDTLGMGAVLFGTAGTAWVQDSAAANVDWTYGYFYASSDPHADLEGFTWLTNFRLDTAEGAGATIPTVTFYRMLEVGREHGHTGGEIEVVEAMVNDADAVRDYIDDFIVVLDILAERDTPSLLHVEPDSWGFMMWAFQGVDGNQGNPDATATHVALSEAAHPALAGQSFPDDAGGLGRAMLYLRDEHAPDVRLGWHASNFRVGTHPEVVTGFYSSMGDWDVLVTDAPHMVSSGAAEWDVTERDNAANLNWFATVSSETGLPILIWQAYKEEVEPYLGAWPQNKANLTALAESGVAAVMWDPYQHDCAYACPEAATLQQYLANYSVDPVTLPAGTPCAP